MILLLLLALPPSGDGCQELVARARDAYDRREYAEAARGFGAALSRCPATGPLLLALAKAQLLARDVEAALRTLDGLLALEPGGVDALKVYARALYLAGRDADAERTLLRAHDLAPEDDEVAYDLGRIYYEQKRYLDAAAQFRLAIALNPRSHKAHDNLGLAAEALGDVRGALRHYLKAVELVHADHPQYDVVYANLADLMLRLGESRKAFDLAAEAAERNPDDPRNLFLAGKALVEMERYGLSLKWLERAAAVDPSYAEARYVLAQVYRRLGRIAEADRELRAFREAQARAPERR